MRIARNCGAQSRQSLAPPPSVPLTRLAAGGSPQMRYSAPHQVMLSAHHQSIPSGAAAVASCGIRPRAGSALARNSYAHAVSSISPSYLRGCRMYHASTTASALVLSAPSPAALLSRRRGLGQGRGSLRLACSLTDVEDEGDVPPLPAILKRRPPQVDPEMLPPPPAPAAGAKRASGGGGGGGAEGSGTGADAAAAAAAAARGGGGSAVPGVRGYATYGPRPSGPERSGGCGAIGGGKGDGGEGGCDSGGAGGGPPLSPPSPPIPEPRSPEDVVSAHVDRQSTTAPERLDPAGAQDSRQQPPPAAAPPPPAKEPTHGSLPPLDHIRPPRRPGGGGSSANGGDAAAGAKGKRSAAGGGNGSASVSVSGGGGGGDDGGQFAGLTPGAGWAGVAVPAVPCCSVGFGTRAEVVARLPASIMLLRHAECMTLDELQAHERVPNHDIPLAEAGVAQARGLGRRLRPVLGAAGMHLFMYTSPFLRCSETARILAEELAEGGLVSGCREAVQLREQDWGNFQDPQVQAHCKAERLRYGRFYYRFPSGESVADVYDRLTIFQDHLVRDMCAGRFQENTCVAVVTHGLTLRVFCMRWIHWTVRQFLQVYNVPNAEPILLHKDVPPAYLEGDNAALPFMPHHTKCLYRLTPRALELLRGADPSMAGSDGCWHGRLLAPPAPLGPTCPEEEARQWADVDGMVQRPGTSRLEG